MLKIFRMEFKLLKILISISSLLCVQTKATVDSEKKFSFSCVGRPAGYYADLETGCQVYHMCDGLGRQFSYSCPNTTLFQQRMLICDHWYMVNCSTSERDYAVNFLIGQRNKPFVNDGEANFRTPRPDLLDKNLLTDYNVHLFNTPKKHNSAANNQIENKDAQIKQQLKNTNNRQQHWKITTSPAQDIPTAFKELKHSQKVNVTTQNLSFKSPKRIDFSDSEDLGTSHSTRYNTSADFESNETPTSPALKHDKPSHTRSNVSLPSRIYQPPFLYPIYNENDTLLSKKLPLTTATAAPFRSRYEIIPSTTTSATITHPTTLRGKPFTVAKTLKKTQENLFQTTFSNKTIRKENTDANKITPAQGFISTLKNNTHPSTGQIILPVKTLQPPKTELIIHDVASTQGPPIYYEWKELVNVLEPPKLDPPFGVNGREYPESFPDFSGGKNSVSSSTNLLTTSFEQKLEEAKTRKDNLQSGVRATKSINEDDSKSPNSKTHSSPQIPQNDDINELRKILAVPEFIFPLENVARTGYGAEGSFNSFQLKIPERRDAAIVTPKNEAWYGENANCPQCHPAYVKPGTCEPCIKT